MSKFLKAVVLGLLALAPTAVWAAPSKCVLGIGGELPVTMRGQRPMVTGQINGEDVTFLADSGAFYSSITESKAKALQLPLSAVKSIQVQGVGGLAPASVATVQNFGIAGQALPRREFLVLPSMGGDADGLLGQNILGVTDMEYDLAHGMIRFMVPRDCGAKSNLAYWAPDGKYATLALERWSFGEPHIIGTVEVNGVKLRALFDTGAALSSMSRAAAARIGLTPDSPGVQPAGEVGGIGARTRASWIGPVAKFNLGGEAITNTRVRFFEGELNADMLIGADFFLSHRVYVSKSQRRLYFTYTGGPVFDLTTRATPASQTRAAAPAAEPLADAPAYIRRGAFAESRQDYASAIADFSKAIALKPDAPDYLYRRAVAYGRAREEAKARADLDRAIALDPNHVESRITRGALAGEKDKAAARADFEAVAKGAAKDSDVHLQLAHLYAGMDDYEPAVAEYDLWVGSHANSAGLGDALNGRCWARAMLGRSLDKALDDCNRALTLQRSPNRLDSRGMVQLRLGAYDKALADYNEALKARPDIDWSLYGRGLAKLAKGQKAEGEADLAAAAKLSPKIAAEAKAFGIGPEMLAKAKP